MWGMALSDSVDLSTLGGLDCPGVDRGVNIPSILLKRTSSISLLWNVVNKSRRTWRHWGRRSVSVEQKDWSCVHWWPSTPWCSSRPSAWRPLRAIPTLPEWFQNQSPLPKYCGYIKARRHCVKAEIVTTKSMYRNIEPVKRVSRTGRLLWRPPAFILQSIPND